MYDELQHMQLVSKAQQGDQEALSSLIRQHRMKMVQWANRIVRSSPKAEDIVQDALIQIFRRIESLDDPGKFVPWLRALVRNQSLMALRSSSSRYEQTIDILALDERQASQAGEIMTDPLIRALGSDAVAEAEKLLSRLSSRERLVMISHVLEGLSVAETAAKLGMNNGAVYTALSRARSKLADYRFESEIDRYMASKRRSHQPETGHVIDARYGRYAAAYDTLCSMIMITAASAHIRGISLSDIFGATGHAFRFHAACDLGISGPYAYDWKASLSAGWSNLALSSAVYGGPAVLLQQPDDLIACMDDMRAALSRGWPVIAWGLNNAEFGMITGFDDHKRSWSVADTSVSGKLLPYDKLGRGRQTMEWFAAIPKPSQHSSHRPHPAAGILRLAVRHIRGEDVKSFDAVSGAAAYKLWIDSFNRQQSVDPLSVAYNMAVVAEARQHAVIFLHRLLDGTWYGGRLPEPLRPAVSYTARLFEQISELLRSITRLFPLPYGADPASPGPADRAASLLSRAAALELEAASVMEAAVPLIDRTNRFGARM